ncbi:MAG TPA: DEAD/DEAH box helicase [Clostridiales bacterium]|nr:DEAD/DEAH box helicase [Clostridiales bacterium]
MSQENKFTALDVSRDVLKALERMGISEPTQIQLETIPPMMAGRDIIGIAPTGTGKTIAFGIPMLEYISLTETRIQELVLAPTRELAMQIVAELTDLVRFIPQIRIAALYGGQPMSRQITQLKRKPQIIVATPGRLLDMQNRGHVRLDQVHTMVIDEADEMLKMGFVKDVTKIIESVPPTRQLVMFSATTNRDVMTISWKFQHTPIEITVEATEENRPQIKQYTMVVPRENKMGALQYLLDSDEYDRIMIFVNTKFMTQRVCDRLRKQGYQAEALHGDIRQSQRTRIMNDYKAGRFPILVATDVAARGIDVDDVEAVINYDLPNENEYYLHRIGRTGRARKHGVAFTMMTFQESVRMDEIQRYMDTQPTPLHFDETRILRHADGEAFFENI